MTKSLITVISVAMVGCSVFFEIDPQISQVKKVGFLSVYINNDFYDRRSFKEDLGLEMLGFFGEADTGTQQRDIPLELAEYLLEEFYRDMEKSLGGVHLVAVNDYVSSEHYQRPIKENSEELDIFHFDDSFQIEKNYFTAPAGLKLLPLNKIVKRFNTKEEQEGLISSSVSYEEVGAFAQRLGFDGLLIIEIDAGYEKLEFLDKNKIKPSITLRILLIDKNGLAVLNVGHLFKNERKLYTGKTIAVQFRDEYIDFKFNADEISDAYRKAIDQGIEDIFSVIRNAL